MVSSTNTGMDILSRNIPDNYDKVRSRTSSPKPQSSRAFSMFSTKSLVVYHEIIEYNNGLNEDIDMGDDSSQLFYAMSKEKTNHVSIAANSNNNTMNMYVPIECPISSSPCIDDTVINIQLLYNPNTPMEPKI